MLLLAIEANLLVWLMVLGNALSHGSDPFTSTTATVDSKLLFGGFLLSAVLQHVAYYRLHRRNAVTEKAPCG